MAAHTLVTGLPRSFRLLAPARQVTVGAILSANSAKKESQEDPVKRLFLDKLKAS
jgi:hypothetical protein